LLVMLLLPVKLHADFANFIEKHKNYQNDVNGLGGSRIAMSPDESTLYGIGFSLGAVAVFSRDPDSGRLTYLESHIDGQNGVNGLWGALDIVVSPDGRFLYVAGYFDEAIVIFARDLETGLLDFKNFYRPKDHVPEATSFISSLKISKDGSKLFIAGGNSSATAFGITAFHRDIETGDIEFVDLIEYNLDDDTGPPSLNGATQFELDCDASHLYVAGSGSSSLGVFSVHPETGKLAVIQEISELDDGVAGLSAVQNLNFDSSYRFLYTLGKKMGEGNISIGLYQRNPENGTLSFVGLTGNPGNEVYSPYSPEVLKISPFTKSAIAPSSAFDLIVDYVRNPQTGMIEIEGSIENDIFADNALDQPRYVLYSKDTKFLYTTSSNDSSVSVWRLNQDDTLSIDGFEDCF